MTDKPDIEILFRRHWPEMFRLAAMLLHDEASARDVVQEVFIWVVDTPGKELPGRIYLLSAVRNRCLNRLRHLDVRRRVHGLFMMEDISSEAEMDNWPDEETLVLVGRVMRECLTDRCREVVRLRFRDDMTYREIACKLGISETAVGKHLRNAMETFRKKLLPNG